MSAVKATIPFLLTLSFNTKWGDIFNEWKQNNERIVENWQYPAELVNTLILNARDNTDFFDWLTDPDRVEEWRNVCIEMMKPYPLKPSHLSFMYKPPSKFQGFKDELAEIEIPMELMGNSVDLTTIKPDVLSGKTQPSGKILTTINSDSVVRSSSGKIVHSGKTDSVVRSTQRGKKAHFPLTGGGYISFKWQRCGRSNCRCNNGQRHGPYAWKRPEWKYLGKVGSAEFQANCDIYEINAEEIENYVTESH